MVISIEEKKIQSDWGSKAFDWEGGGGICTPYPPPHAATDNCVLKVHNIDCFHTTAKCVF